MSNSHIYSQMSRFINSISYYIPDFSLLQTRDFLLLSHGNKIHIFSNHIKIYILPMYNSLHGEYILLCY